MPLNKGELKRDSVAIDGEKLREKVGTLSVPATIISEQILGKHKSYISGCCKDNVMNKGSLDKLCLVFNLNPDEFIRKVEAKPDIPPVKDETLEKKLDTLITLMSELVRKQSSIENALGRLVSVDTRISEHLDIDLDSIDDSLGKIVSKCNTIDGRLKDASKMPIQDAVKEASKTIRIAK